MTDKDVHDRAWQAMERQANHLAELADEIRKKIAARNRGDVTSRESIRALFPLLSQMGSSLDSIRRDRRYLQQQETTEG